MNGLSNLVLFGLRFLPLPFPLRFMSSPPSSTTTASATPSRTRNRNRISSIFSFSWIRPLKRSKTADKLYKKYVLSYKLK